MLALNIDLPVSLLALDIDRRLASEAPPPWREALLLTLTRGGDHAAWRAGP